MKGLRLELEIVDIGPDGKVRGARRCPVNSWLANASALFHSGFDATPSTPGAQATDINGNTRFMQWRDGIGFSAHHFEMNGSVGQARGILIGTGVTPVATTDFRIEAIIPHGNGAGQLYRQAQGVNPSPVPIAGGYQVQMFRQFDNNSGGPITISEVGIYAFHNHYHDQQETFMALRDLVPGGHVVADGSSVVIRYFFNWTV